MARFSQTLKNLKDIAAHVPGSMASPKNDKDGGKQEAFEKALIDVLMKEDYSAVKIALLCDKLITKYKGRAV